MSKYRSLDEQEERLCKENGIDTKGVTVSFRDKDVIHLLKFDTRDTIIIRRGDRQWS